MQAFNKLVSCLACALSMLALPLTALAAQHCVVLQYHHVAEDTPGITSVTPAQFAAHLDYLQEKQYQVLALREVVDAIVARKPLPEGCVAITFDDAYRSIHDTAWPMLRARGMPFTVFVSSANVDRGHKAFMSWDQMRAMAADGVTFENHSHTHAHLLRRHEGERVDDWEQRVASDILTAQNRISRELGQVPTLFAYPYGEYNTALADMIRSMQLVGFGQQSGPVWPGADLATLPRFPMNITYANMRTFPTKVSSLPLPILSAEPAEPVVPVEQWSPTLTLTFSRQALHPERLTCYVNGSPAVTYRWENTEPKTVHVTPKGRLTVGRNRYNCTLPAGNGRYHWYSHLWIRRRADGSWYTE